MSGLEDLHWADPGSLELLHYLAVQIRTMPLLLLVTYRVDEPSQGHPFSRQLPALIRDAEGLRIDLRRLDIDALRSLVASRSRLAKPDEDRLVDYLERHAEGNPLYANELLRTLEEEGRLRQIGESWELDDIDRVVLPPYLRQVIEGRVVRLGEGMQQPLAMAAVIGQEVPLDLWANVTGMEEERHLTVIDHAVDAHLLEAEVVGIRIRFVHALTRAALYGGVLPPRRRIWHRRVGEELAESSPADPDAVAYHFQQAGDSRAWEWLVRAGERAQRAYAWLTAAERLARLVHDRVLAAEARHSRGVLRCYAGDFGLGIEDMAAGVSALEALPTDEAFPSDTTSAWFADALPANGHDGAAEFDAGAIELSRLGMSHRRGSPPWFLAVAGHLAEAQTMGEGYLAKARGVSRAGELVRSSSGHTLQGLAIAHATLGRPGQARSAYAAAREVYATLDHHALIVFTLLGELEDVVLPYYATDVAERRRPAREAEEALQRAGGALLAGVSPRRAWLGVYFIEGRWAEALEIAADASMHGIDFLRRQEKCVLAQLARYQDEPERVRSYVRLVLPQGPATEPGACVFADALLCQRLAADLELEDGNLAVAYDWLTANDRWLAWNGSVLGRACNRIAWARYFRVAGAMGRARVHAAEALERASQPEQPLAHLTAHRLLGELVGAERAHDAEYHFATSLALADACAAPYERALTLLALASHRAATSQISEAANLLAEVRSICTPLGARLALRRADALQAALDGLAAPTLPAGLTQREAEVLSLVAGGLTNAEVGQRLSISERTVAQHLRTIYSKLDVTSRVGATRFAIDHHLV